jgi:valyl-tRNA synthetase
MKEITQPAYENVMNDTIQLIPPKFKNTYRHWMENVRDWCISRQLWWGHRIPAWYDGDGNYVVAKTHDEALEEYKSKYPSRKATSLTQDPDVMDTWFSSWLWPIAVFDTTIFKDGNKGNKDLNYYYPTNDLVTAPEILFFWVARMIIAGYEYRGAKPFTNVYLTGIVRDKLGRKMSKSLGNSPDPLDLIANSGADAVRFGMLRSSPAGNDLPYDDKLIEEGSRFNNKIWNAYRLVKGWTTTDAAMPVENRIAIDWFESRLNRSLEELNDHFTKFRMSDALMITRGLIWDDFCSWYLEMVKPPFESPIDKETYEKTVSFFETVLRALHPFMPFITEELWHELKHRPERDCIIVASWPKANQYNNDILAEASLSFSIITEIRNVRSSKGLSPKDAVPLLIKSKDAVYKSFWPIIKKLSNLSDITLTNETPANATSFVIRSVEFFVPIAGKIDVTKERELILKDLEYQKGFIVSLDKKLLNEKFMSSAPEKVVEMEKKKKADAEAKIKALEQQLAALG